MAPRRKAPRNLKLLPGMRERDGYYSWRDPDTGTEHGLGTDKASALEQVSQVLVARSTRPLKLLEKLEGGANSWGTWCEEFWKIIEARKLRPNTMRSLKSRMSAARKAFDVAMPASRITTRQCAELVDGIAAAGKHRSAQAMKAFLLDCFRSMKAKGWRKDNPAEDLDNVRVVVKRARLSLETFLALYRGSESAWLRNAMALALVSGQARETVCGALFADFREGYWWIERGKTGARIMLPLTLRLDALGISLEEVAAQCRRTGVLSRHLVHQTKRIKGATLGKGIHPDMLTRVFSRELDALGMDWGGKQGPTFHEIRSLSSRLHKAQGSVNPQELLGHRDPRTTAVYTDGRGEWVKVCVK